MLALSLWLSRLLVPLVYKPKCRTTALVNLSLFSILCCENLNITIGCQLWVVNYRLSAIGCQLWLGLEVEYFEISSLIPRAKCRKTKSILNTDFLWFWIDTDLEDSFFSQPHDRIPRNRWLSLVLLRVCLIIRLHTSLYHTLLPRLSAVAV